MNLRATAATLSLLLLLFAGPSYCQQNAPAKTDSKQHLSQDKVRVTLGTISLGGVYSNAPCPYFVYGCYGVLPLAAAYPYPLFYPALFPPAYFASFVPHGTVKLEASPARASVYIDGAYAGSANRLKTFPLASGAYDLEVRTSGYQAFHQRIYILTDRTLKIAAHLSPLPPRPGEKP